MKADDKAMELITQAEVQQAEFRTDTQNLLAQQLRALQDGAEGEEKVVLDKMLQDVMESAAKAKAHKDMCEIMLKVIDHRQR